MFSKNSGNPLSKMRPYKNLDILQKRMIFFIKINNCQYPLLRDMITPNVTSKQSLQEGSHMKTDEKGINDREFTGDASSGQAPEIEEIIDLVDEVVPNHDSSQIKQATEIDLQTEDEDLIELIDTVKENTSETLIGNTTLELEVGERLEPGGQHAPEKEEPIGLIDEDLLEVDFGQQQEEVDPGDLVENLGLYDEETELPESSEAETGMSETDEDRLTEILGIEMPDEDTEIPSETPAKQAPEPIVYSGLAMEELSESQPSEGIPEPGVGALEQAVIEKLTDEKIEEITIGVVKQAIEGKVERILLEAAQAAISREIERLKQAL